MVGLGRLVRGIKKETGWRYAFVHPDNTFVHLTSKKCGMLSIGTRHTILLFYTDVVPHYKLSNDSWPPWDSLRRCTLWTLLEWESLEQALPHPVVAPNVSTWEVMVW